MSRNCKYVLLGALWTATTVLFFTQNLLSVPLDSISATLLPVALAPTVILFATAGVTDSPWARWFGVLLHMVVPVIWTCQMAQTAGVYIDSNAFFWISFTTLVGCTVSDLALSLDVTELSVSDLFFNEAEERRRAEAAVRSGGAFDSGGFGPLLAYDSGAFKNL